MDDLKDLWNDSRSNLKVQEDNTEQLIMKAEKKKKSNYYFHLLNIFILTTTLVGISLFFYYVAPLKTLLSRTGMALMTGSLLIRIGIEVMSSIKSSKIDLTKDALNATEDALEFFNYRKRIHGLITLIIVALYTFGFYMLTPEFSLYLNTVSMILIHVSYVLGAFFLVWQIRNGIRKEMKNLQEIVSLKSEIIKEE